MTVTIDEWREIHAAHPSRQIRVGDYLLTIDTPCISCKGVGSLPPPINFEYFECPECDGHGRRLTAEGQVLVAAMREWLGAGQVML